MNHLDLLRDPKKPQHSPGVCLECRNLAQGFQLCGHDDCCQEPCNHVDCCGGVFELAGGAA